LISGQCLICFVYRGNKIVSILLTIVVIGVNLYFVVVQVESMEIKGGLLALVCEYTILSITINLC